MGGSNTTVLKHQTWFFLGLNRNERSSLGEARPEVAVKATPLRPGSALRLTSLTASFTAVSPPAPAPYCI